MSDTPISDLLPNVTADLEPGQVVLDGMVLLRVVDPSTGERPSLVIASTPDLDWMLQVGMLHTAREICTSDIGQDEQEEDE